MPKKSRYKHEDYTTVAIPKEMVERIDRIVADQKLAYVSSGEFVRDAVRRRLEELEEKARKRVKPS